MENVTKKVIKKHNPTNHSQGHMAEVLERMKMQIKCLLERDFSPSGGDLTPIFNTAKCIMIDDVVSGIKFELLANRGQDVRSFQESLEDILKMQL